MIILDAQPMPDGLFYYSLSTLLALAIIAIIWRYVGKTDDMLKELKQAVQTLMINDKVQDSRIEDLEDHNKIVKYRGNGDN